MPLNNGELIFFSVLCETWYLRKVSEKLRECLLNSFGNTERHKRNKIPTIPNQGSASETK